MKPPWVETVFGQRLDSLVRQAFDLNGQHQNDPFLR